MIIMQHVRGSQLKAAAEIPLTFGVNCAENEYVLN